MSQFTIRVYGILVNEKKQILVSDEIIGGQFYTKFPGGGLEYGEGTRDCLRREFKEETGLDVVVTEHLYTTDFFQPSAFHSNAQVISIYYLVTCKNYASLQTTSKPFDFSEAQLSRNADCEVFRWIDLQHLSSDDVSLPIDKLVVNEYLTNLIC